MKLSPPTRPSEPFTATGIGPVAARPAARPRKSAGPMRWYALLVLLPTLLVGTYYTFVASDIYESEARFLVRGRQAPSGGSTLASMISGAAAMRPGSEEARAVSEFIDSHDAVSQLREKLDLTDIWRRPEADRVARLWWEDPDAERLLRYYRRRVSVDYNIETGISTLRVLAFRPGDAKEMAENLLRMSEALVNRFSERTIQDALRVAQEEVTLAEQRVIAAREALAGFREREQALDPTQSAVAALENISRLEAALAQARADLQERRSFMRADNPQIQLLQNRISALTTQIAAERARTTRGQEALTQQVSGFERLTLERDFAEQQLASARASLEQARSDALKQQVFLMRVVEPHLPQRALHPKGLFNTLTVLVSLSVLFGIGWLLIAGAREHAN